mmetsp:Transcript_23615/g.93278  ORF Transcript_23615/g.93278 Transcript_23615/m.93278 type:complete len:329 (-) Transcript_23615:437-1423(-)
MGLLFVGNGVGGCLSARGGVARCSRRGQRIFAVPKAEDILKLLNEDEEEDESSWENSEEYKQFLAQNEGKEFMRHDSLKIADAMDFFRIREGKWTSRRFTHHLAFRRDESGFSSINVECLEKDDERIIALCKENEVDPQMAQGGCYVTWEAELEWGQEDESYDGSTIFALVPDEDNARKGRLLRDRGYAEIVPIVGFYDLDEEDALNLVTPYDGGEVVEQFYYDGPDIINRISTVKRMGGFSTGTLAIETRQNVDIPEANTFGESLMKEGQDEFLEKVKEREQKPSTSTYGNRLGLYGRNAGKPSPRSAFGPPSSRSAFGPPSKGTDS